MLTDSIRPYGPVVIDIDNITKHYVMGEETVHALRGVTLQIRRNEYLAIMGPSGSGKSTLMNMLGCLDTPSSGRYEFNGKSVSEMPVLKMSRNLIPVIGLDTVKNEYRLHREIHQWLANGPMTASDVLVTKIYDELFLSPLNDPWYGLSKPDVYSAVENDGRQNAVTTNQNVGHRR